MVELCGAQRARSAAGVVQRQLCCVRTGGSGAVAGQPTAPQGWSHTLCVAMKESEQVVRAREVVLPWVHVWSTTMSDRLGSVHFTRRSCYYTTAPKPDLTCSSERVFKRDDTQNTELDHRTDRFNGVTRQFPQ